MVAVYLTFSRSRISYHTILVLQYFVTKLGVSKSVSSYKFRPKYSGQTDKYCFQLSAAQDWNFLPACIIICLIVNCNTLKSRIFIFISINFII